MPIERKSYPVADLKVAEEAGIIEAIVSVFSNVDHGNEKVMPGFFSKSIEKKLPKGVWAHDWKQPIAKTLEAKELLPGDPQLPPQLSTLGGAYIKGQFNLDTQRGREAYSDIKFGIVDEFSIGYSVSKDAKDKESGARELIEGDWKEWSPVLVGMNELTSLISIKSEETPFDEQLKTLIVGHTDEEILTVLNDGEEKFNLKGITESESFGSFESVETALENFAQKMRRHNAARLKEGRVLSSSNRSKIQACMESLMALHGELSDLMAMSEPKPKGKDVEALRNQHDRMRQQIYSLISP